MAYDLPLVHVEVADGIATATIDNPPINLMTLDLFGQLATLAEAVEQDPDVRVLVLRSADPDFFIAHFDVELILQFPDERAGRARDRAQPVPPDVRTAADDAQGDDLRGRRARRRRRE